MTTKLQQGAYNAIKECINLLPEEKIVIITDNPAYEVGEALRDEAAKITPHILFLKIEDFVERPAHAMPQQVLDQIREFKPVASIYAAHGMAGELPVFRRPLINFLIKELGCRHAHMISITKEIMEIGMNQDLEQVYNITHALKRRLDKSKYVRVKDHHGSDVVFELNNTVRRNVPDDMKIKPGKMANLPGGEVYTCPVNVNGTLVAWLLGDSFDAKYGELKSPLVIEVKQGYVHSVDVRGQAPKELYELKDEFEKYISEYENGKRVGELGIGTLVGLTHFIGNMLQDEKFPGVHVAFGGSYPDDTGADWNCPSHVDVVLKHTTIELEYETGDTELIMQDGVYLADLASR